MTGAIRREDCVAVCAAITASTVRRSVVWRSTRTASKSALAAELREFLGLLVGPTVARVAGRARSRSPFDRDESATGFEHTTDFAERAVEVGPVVHGRDRPEHRRAAVGQRQRFGRALAQRDPVTSAREPAGQAQHHRRRIDTGDRRAEAGRVPDRGAGTAAHVDDPIAGLRARQPFREICVARASEGHAEPGKESERTGEPGVVGVVVRCCRCDGHARRLTVEPEFKSSGNVDDANLTIGDVAREAGVATSSVRYYERRGLLDADGRQSGQRRYRTPALRRLVFIKMLQDAGLSLDDIAGVLHADSVADWKAIVARRLETLAAEIEELERARAYLEGALLCRFDHPATDCKIMGAEIDRRLASGRAPST